MITLTATRGDTFGYSCTLSVDPSTYDEIKFTVRAGIPDSSVTTDSDALAQASTQAGYDGTITVIGMVVTITLPASVTNSWPLQTLRWDMQGVISGEPVVVHTFKNEDESVGGALAVQGDVTRSN